MLLGSLTRYRSGVCQIRLFPQSVWSIHDLVARHARPVLVISGVSFRTNGKKNNRVADLDQLARSCGVAHRDYSDLDAIAIAREDLTTLLSAEFFHWNFTCWDTPREPLPSALGRQAAGSWGVLGGGTPALHVLDGASLFVYCHDDDHLTVEGRGPGLARAVFARALEGLVADAAGATTGRPRHAFTIADVPDAITDYFCSTLPLFALKPIRTPGKPGRVRLAFGAEVPQWRGGEFQSVGHIDYDLHSERWMHRYR